MNDDEALKKQGLDAATVAKELAGISKGGDLVHLAPDAPNLVKTITSKGTNCSSYHDIKMMPRLF